MKKTDENASLVSVVITTYNRPDRLKKALKTVIDQTYKNLEIIVVDGNNSKENEDVVKSFNDDIIKYLQVEPEKVKAPSYEGVQHARNLGCKKATGQYIAMLDDDDLWAPEKIQKQMKEFKDESVALVISYSKMHFKNSSVIYKNKLSPTYKDLLKRFDLSTTSSFLIRNDVLKEINYWNESLRGMHEYDIALKIAKKKYKIVTIPEPLTIRHRYGSDFSINPKIKISEIMDFWQYYGKEFIPNLGFKGFLFNTIKMMILLDANIIGYFLKRNTLTSNYQLKSFFQKRHLKT